MRPLRKITIAAVVIAVPLAAWWFFAPRIICHLGDQREEFVLATMKGINEAVLSFGRCPTASERGLASSCTAGICLKSRLIPGGAATNIARTVIAIRSRPLARMVGQAAQERMRTSNERSAVLQIRHWR